MSGLSIGIALLYFSVIHHILMKRVDRLHKRIQTIEKRLVELEVTVDDLEEVNERSAQAND